VKLSLRQKEIFYHQLGQLLRSGIAFPRALQTLADRSSRGVLQLASHLSTAVGRGEGVADAFATAPGVHAVESTVIAAAARSGRLDAGCKHLSEYFKTLERAREAVVRKLAYPLFVLHLGIFLLALPKLFSAGAGAYARSTVGLLMVLYAVIGLIWLAAKSLSRISATVVLSDRLLLALPLVGKVRRAFALARFCSTYEMQLHAGVNVLDSLAGAARASRSAFVAHAVRSVMPRVRAGERVFAQLKNASAFSSGMTRALAIAEETGDLDQELIRQAREFHAEAVVRMEALSEWVPRLTYMAVVCYVGYQIITMYQALLDTYGSLLE
jgi:type IV pilus assembly protein PilC